MTGAYLHSTGNSMTRTEQEVMRRWDANASMEQIARAMPLRIARVRQIVSRFYDSGEHARHCTAIAAGSAALLQALKPGNQA